MSLTVSDLLAMPVLAAARPEVVAGSALASRPIRWVHTSEIYDIAPLLKGGEVLFTTGLGLVASSPKAQGDYVRALAAKGVAALVMELGRTFTAPPGSMVEAARETGLPLVVLHGVVPFIEVTEQVHPLLLSEPDPETTPSRGPADELLAGLAAGSLSSDEITALASQAGFGISATERCLALVVRVTTYAPGSSGATALRAAVSRLGRGLIAELDRRLLVVAAVRGPAALGLRVTLHELVEELDRELTATVGGHVLQVTAGNVVDDVSGLARSVPVALEAARLAESLTLGSRIVLANDLGVYHILSAVVADDELERFVAEQLGQLLERDARTGSDLVQTLDAYLEAGLSKTAAASALGIRRQTLYARLEQVSHVLGGLDLTDRHRRTALDLALVAWRLRTSAAGRGRMYGERPGEH